MNDIKTWQQGHFVDQPRYKKWSEQRKKNSEHLENLLVRPTPTENAICKCETPYDSEWIASRLNLASELEQLTYDYATGKTDGSELTIFVKNKIGV